MGTTLYIEDNNKVISTVATTAETTKSAMVVAVATHKKYRNQGHATRLMKALSKLYLKDKHKELCLFYDNPEAGKIYLNLGFKPMGQWTMFRK
jgi:predicted GNAT family acetyltransferase